MRTACAGMPSASTSSPTSSEFAALKNHRWRLFTTLLRNSLDGKRIEHAQESIFRLLIRQIQSQGYQAS